MKNEGNERERERAFYFNIEKCLKCFSEVGEFPA